MIQLPRGKELFYAIIIDKNGLVRFDSIGCVPEALREKAEFQDNEPKGRQYCVPLKLYREWENGTNANDSK